MNTLSISTEISPYSRKCIQRTFRVCPIQSNFGRNLSPTCAVCTPRSNSVFIVIRARFLLNSQSDTNKTDTRPQRNTCGMFVGTFDSRDLYELSIAKSNRVFMVSSAIFIGATRINCAQVGVECRGGHTHHHFLFITFLEMAQNQEPL